MKKIGILLILVMLMQCLSIITVQALPRISLQLRYDNEIHMYNEEPFRVTVNNQTVESDPPPVILFDCTMIPTRALFEMLGSSVQWDNDNRKVIIHYNKNTIILTIDSVLAEVNGQTTLMMMPAKIINDRTFIPFRFVGENLGFKVNWDGVNRIASIEAPIIKTPEPATPTPVTKTTISNIDTEAFGNTFRVIISGDKPITNLSAFDIHTNNDPRYVIDIQNAILPNKNFSKEVNNGYVRSIRASQFSDTVVRVVLDLSSKNYALWQPNNKAQIFIDFDTSMLTPTPTITPIISPSLDPNIKPGAVLNPKAADRLVIIDPGHGGTEPGATAMYNGKQVLEKDINLAISLKLNAILQNAGVKTHMLRTGDQTISLFERPQIANNMNASLFVSIHCNAFEQSSVKGTETFYNNADEIATYGISSKKLAQYVQAELIKSLNTANRGVKDGSKLVVLSKSNMPSVLVETAFLSNPNDIKLLMSNSFQDATAQAIATAIICALNEMVME